MVGQSIEPLDESDIDRRAADEDSAGRDCSSPISEGHRSTESGDGDQACGTNPEFWSTATAGWFVVGAIALALLSTSLVVELSQGWLSPPPSPLKIAPALQLDINSATAEQLQALPEVGELLAKRIVENRELQGPFAEVADLVRVRGFGPTTLDRLKSMLVTEHELPHSGSQQLADGERRTETEPTAGASSERP